MTINLEQRIAIDWTNYELSVSTDNKSRRALGTPYEIDENFPFEVVFTRAQLLAKLRLLQSVKNDFVDIRNNPYEQIKPTVFQRILNNTRIPRIREAGEATGAATIRKLKRDIVDALFKTNDRPPSAVSYFSWSSLQTDGGYIAALDFSIDILNGFIKIVEDALNITPGLSRVVDEDVEEPTEVEFGRVPAGTKYAFINVQVKKLNVPLLSVLTNAITDLVNEKTENFFDKDRELKTIVNFGSDIQPLAVSWRKSPTNERIVQVKLDSPLKDEVDIGYNAYVVREISNSVIDNIEFKFTKDVDNTPFLRPAISSNVGKNTKVSRDITISSLGLLTGSIGDTASGTSSFADDIFRRWYTDDFKSSELNVDFSSYENFVHFSSAVNRLESFAQKLSDIERLKQFTLTSTITETPSIKSIEIESIIRGMDLYERFLYFEPTGSVIYTASADYTDSGIEYNADATWPKTSLGEPYHPTSSQAQAWLDVQLPIATRYDDNNPNNLTYSLPEYLSVDNNSSEFIRFVSMVGHLFDNIKIYIDQFGHMYSTIPNPYEELTMDQVHEVAESFGFELPNVNSLYELVSFIDNVESEQGSRTLVVEAWKRFIHNLILFYKSKGSRKSFDELLNVYGLSSPLLQIKEQSAAKATNYLLSDEYVYGVEFDSSSASYFAVPFTTASLEPTTIQIRFKPEVNDNYTFLSADNDWSIDLITSSRSEYGKLRFISASSTVATSSTFYLFGDDYTNLMITSESGDIKYYINQNDGYQIVFQETGSVSLPWDVQTLYIGASGSLKLDSKNFSGIVDEVRVWGELQNTESFNRFSYDPGSYVGSNYTSSMDSLYYMVSINTPATSITESLVNETPRTGSVPQINTSGLTTGSYTRLLRTIRQSSPVVGGTSYSSNKITIASAPVFKQSSLDENGVKTLSRKASIVSLRDKIYDYYGNRSVVSMAVSPSDFINQNIIRSLGTVDINSLIGNPGNLYRTSYPELTDLQNTYIDLFEETVNPNDFISYFTNIIQLPVETAEKMVPAKTTFIDGITIQPTILERNKMVISSAPTVDGTGTRRNDTLIETGSTNQYDYGVVSLETSESIDQADYVQQLDTGSFDLLEVEVLLSESVVVRSSTPLAKRPNATRAIQYLEPCTQQNVNDCIGRASTSLFDELSGVVFVNAQPHEVVSINSEYTSSGYPRDPFDKSISEINTLTPFYDIPPRSDFTDFGTTNYFHKSTGIYTIPSLVNRNRTQAYLAQFDSTQNTSIALLYAPITLMATSSITSYPERSVEVINVGTISSGSYIGYQTLGGLFTVYNISGTPQTRLRLYASAAARDADITRPFETAPTGSHGVQLDVILESESELVYPYTLVQGDDEGVVYYTVSNLSTSNVLGEFELSIYAYEPADLVPVGYLPRHYKFTRENSTALKRRNYIGCKNTSQTTIDGITPIQIFSTQTNEVIVSRNARLQEGSETSYNIEFGGLGPLDVN